MHKRQLSALDRFIENADGVLRTLSRNANQARRTSPASAADESALETEQRQHIAGLMRVNHTGEVSLVLPQHCSVDLDARSLTGSVRNVFGFSSEPLGKAGSRVQGKIGDGEHSVQVVAKKGTLTVTTAK